MPAPGKLELTVKINEITQRTLHDAKIAADKVAVWV